MALIDAPHKILEPFLFRVEDRYAIIYSVQQGFLKGPGERKSRHTHAVNTKVVIPKYSLYWTFLDEINPQLLVDLGSYVSVNNATVFYTGTKWIVSFIATKIEPEVGAVSFMYKMDGTDFKNLSEPENTYIYSKSAYSVGDVEYFVRNNVLYTAQGETYIPHLLSFGLIVRIAPASNDPELILVTSKKGRNRIVYLYDTNERFIVGEVVVNGDFPHDASILDDKIVYLLEKNCFFTSSYDLAPSNQIAISAPVYINKYFDYEKISSPQVELKTFALDEEIQADTVTIQSTEIVSVIISSTCCITCYSTCVSVVCSDPPDPFDPDDFITIEQSPGSPYTMSITDGCVVVYFPDDANPPNYTACDFVGCETTYCPPITPLYSYNPTTGALVYNRNAVTANTRIKERLSRMSLTSQDDRKFASIRRRFDQLK